MPTTPGGGGMRKTPNTQYRHGSVYIHVGVVIWPSTRVCTCTSQGMDLTAPQRDLLRMPLFQAVSFLGE